MSIGSCPGAGRSSGPEHEHVRGFKKLNVGECKSARGRQCLAVPGEKRQGVISACVFTQRGGIGSVLGDWRGLCFSLPSGDQR